MSRAPSTDPLELLRTGPVPVPTDEELDRERERVLSWLEHEVARVPARIEEHRARVRRRTFGAVAGGLAVAAAATFAVLSVGRPESRGGAATTNAAVEPSSSPATVELVSGRLKSENVELALGSRLGVTSVVEAIFGQDAILRGPSGYVATLAAGGRLALSVEAPAPALANHPLVADPAGDPGEGRPSATLVDLARGDALVLERGLVTLEVPRLEAGKSFRVFTEDARVTVHGTRFSVATTGELGARTCVKVEEGLVEVARASGDTVFLGPGQSSGCDSNASETASGELVGRGRRAPSSRADGPNGGTLAVESKLFSHALSLEKAGDHAAAARELRSLLESYPRSPFASEARTALGRVTRAQPNK